MMRILSWSSGLGCDKMHATDFNMFVPEKQPSSVASVPLPSYLKRKRSPSGSVQTATQSVKSSSLSEHLQQSVKQNIPPEGSDVIQPDNLQHVSSPLGPNLQQKHNMDIQPTNRLHEAPGSATKRTDAQLQTMRQTISCQLSLEILLKHKELRLIDQELAKCQVALEQLRRCAEIPYPGTQSPSENVSAGRGPALRRSGERYPPQSPAPWGVTDGPYSRHYAKWLLPDSRFDGGEPELVASQSAGKTSFSGRPIRGSFADMGQTAGKSARAQRSGKLQALPAGYGQPKEKATGPMIVKRKSDGLMVKLVCPDCGRHDFGSAQGFINHCRIGHQRSFASHDAAADVCGEAVEYDENGAVKGVDPVAAPPNTNVHPLIRSARLLFSSAPATPSLRGGSVSKAERSAHARSSSGISPGFRASSQTPHLSALVKDRGMGLDLQDLVTDAKTKVELPESDHEDEEMEVDSPLAPNSGRHPHVAGSKQPTKSASSPAHSPLLNSRMRLASGNLPADLCQFVSPPQSQPNFHDSDPRRSSFQAVLPSPTNDSTQAPSLIDDDEEMEPQSPPSSDEIDEAEVDFDIQDDEQGDHHTDLRGAEVQSPTACTPAPPPRPRSHAPQPSAIRQSATSKGDKRVTFVGPTLAKDADEGNERKRRKIGEK